jgi:hypothetical protein
MAAHQQQLNGSVGQPGPAPGVLGRLLHGEKAECRRLSGGANNRVWEITCARGKFMLKEYYAARGSDRDRFSSERAFYRLAAPRVSGQVSAALGWDPEGPAALFSWIEGRKLLPGEVAGGHVQQALDFFEALNRDPMPERAALPPAAESASSVWEHLGIIGQRVERLSKISGTDPQSRGAVELIQYGIEPVWGKIRAQVEKDWPKKGRGSLACPPCVSPSDFGFHNALRQPDDRLCFFDFEYAGWDDPAKMLADFFSQPKIPVAGHHFSAAVGRVAKMFPGDRLLAERTQALWPAYRLKWICIMLNEFLPQGENRRAFALGEPVRESLRREKLEQARAALQALGESLA